MPTDKLKVTFYAEDDVAGALKNLESGERSRRINELIRRGLDFSEEATDRLVDNINANKDRINDLHGTFRQVNELWQQREQEWVKQRDQLSSAIVTLTATVERLTATPEWRERLRSAQSAENDINKEGAEGSQQRREALAMLIAQLKPMLDLKAIKNADQMVGAFLLGNENLPKDKTYAVNVEALGKSFLANCLSRHSKDYVQLLGIFTAITKLSMQEMTPLTDRLIGILLQADSDVAAQPELLLTYEAKTTEYLNL